MLNNVFKSTLMTSAIKYQQNSENLMNSQTKNKGVCENLQDIKISVKNLIFVYYLYNFITFFTILFLFLSPFLKSTLIWTEFMLMGLILDMVEAFIQNIHE